MIVAALENPVLMKTKARRILIKARKTPINTLRRSKRWSRRRKRRRRRKMILISF